MFVSLSPNHNFPMNVTGRNWKKPIGMNYSNTSPSFQIGDQRREQMKNESTTIESIQSRLLWNDIFYRIRAKGEHKHNRRCVSDSLCPELTIGQYEELIIEQLKLEKAHPNHNPHSQTYHPMSGFICGLNDSDSKVDQDYLSDFTEFLLDPDDNPGDCENWLRGLIFLISEVPTNHISSPSSIPSGVTM